MFHIGSLFVVPQNHFLVNSDCVSIKIELIPIIRVVLIGPIFCLFCSIISKPIHQNCLGVGVQLGTSPKYRYGLAGMEQLLQICLVDLPIPLEENLLRSYQFIGSIAIQVYDLAVCTVDLCQQNGGSILGKFDCSHHTERETGSPDWSPPAKAQ